MVLRSNGSFLGSGGRFGGRQQSGYLSQLGFGVSLGYLSSSQSLLGRGLAVGEVADLSVQLGDLSFQLSQLGGSFSLYGFQLGGGSFSSGSSFGLGIRGLASLSGDLGFTKNDDGSIKIGLLTFTKQ